MDFSCLLDNRGEVQPPLPGYVGYSNEKKYTHRPNRRVGGRTRRAPRSAPGSAPGRLPLKRNNTLPSIKKDTFINTGGNVLTCPQTISKEPEKVRRVTFATETKIKLF